MGRDIEYMKRALSLAEAAMGRTRHNPMVGALVVQENDIVGQGFHTYAGVLHAETVALQEAGEKAIGATLYVTLEPCCHYGRTGPCVDKIIKAGISRVVVAMQDPNPLVSGKGLDRLKQAGIEVSVGVMEEKAKRLNEVFVKYITTGMPFVVLKSAVSLDGKIATRTGDSRWITGPKAREYGHRLRDRYDAIMVGINTVVADNPCLTTRLPQGGKDPIRIVLDSKARIPVDAKVINHHSESHTIIATTNEAPLKKVRLLEKAGAEVIYAGSKGQVDIKLLMKKLAEKKITSILIEGGGLVNSSALEAGVVDKVNWFISPMLIGGQQALVPLAGLGAESLNDAINLVDVKVCSLGKDILIEGYISRGEV